MKKLVMLSEENTENILLAKITEKNELFFDKMLIKSKKFLKNNEFVYICF